ncbi:HNH endonuclease signature motif containing protein [Streptomyces sp. NPDC047315]|uniref:HNH endonuclease n=1 Tax=Streptomyces sp. NPDC047315 TaxID=3155142 RepID=UPI0033CEE8D0
MASQSRRTSPLPSNWARLRQRILRRDRHRCQRAHDHNPGGICGEPATDVDHITPAHLGGSDDEVNLQALCRWHHDQKTGREASAAAHALPPRTRPAEAHPGLLG